MIPQYQSVVVIGVPKTGFFALAGVKHPLAALVHECVVHLRERQPCRHPEAVHYPQTPFSALELVELDTPQEIHRFKTKWVIAHWNETRDGDKEPNGPWESFQLFLQYGEADAREQYAKSHKLWKERGYFCLPQFDEYQRQVARRKMYAMQARRDVARQVVGHPVAKPQNSNAVMGLFNAQLAVLEPQMPRTVEAMKAKDHKRSIAAFDFESRFPGFFDESEEIDFMIVRAYAREGPLPTDEDIAHEIARHGLPKLSADAIKKRRTKLELFGRNPGPKPRGQ